MLTIKIKIDSDKRVPRPSFSADLCFRSWGHARYENNFVLSAQILFHVQLIESRVLLTRPDAIKRQKTPPPRYIRTFRHSPNYQACRKRVNILLLYTWVGRRAAWNARYQIGGYHLVIKSWKWLSVFFLQRRLPPHFKWLDDENFIPTLKIFSIGEIERFGRRNPLSSELSKW